MRRSTVLSGLALTLGAPSALLAQQSRGDTEVLIRNALSAAPPAVAAHAAVALPTGEILREGTNGYTCMPDDPAVPNNSPMCLDAQWAELIDAWMNHRPPRVTQMGISYMLQGDMPVSNVDPFATGSSSDNAWIQAGPPPPHDRDPRSRDAGGPVHRSRERGALGDVEGHALCAPHGAHRSALAGPARNAAGRPGTSRPGARGRPATI